MLGENPHIYREQGAICCSASTKQRSWLLALESILSRTSLIHIYQALVTTGRQGSCTEPKAAQTRDPQPPGDVVQKKRVGTAGLKDNTHPSHRLFTRLPSGKGYQGIRCCDTWLQSSFFPLAVRLLHLYSKYLCDRFCVVIIYSWIFLRLLFIA